MGCAYSWTPILTGFIFQSFFYSSLGRSTVSEKWRLHMWGQSETFSTSNISSWVFTIPCTLVPDFFVGLSLPLFFFVPFIMIIGWVVHVYYIKFPFRIVPGGPIPILDISGNIILWFIDSPGFNIFKSPNITLFWVPYLSVGAVLGSVTSSYLNFFKDLFFVFIWLRQTIF